MLTHEEGIIDSADTQIVALIVENNGPMAMTEIELAIKDSDINRKYVPAIMETLVTEGRLITQKGAKGNQYLLSTDKLT